MTHLTVIPEMLPCPLKLPVYTNNPIFTRSDTQLPKMNSNQRIQTSIENSKFSKELVDINQPSGVAGNFMPLADQINSKISLSLAVKILSNHHQNSTNEIAHTNFNPTCFTKSQLSKQRNQQTNPIGKGKHFTDNHNNIIISDQNIDRNHSDKMMMISNGSITDDFPNNHLSNMHNQTGDNINSITDPLIGDNHINNNNIDVVNNALEEDGEDEEDDEDYQRLSDFSSIMADLNLTNDKSK